MQTETIQKLASVDRGELVGVVEKCLSDGRMSVADVHALLKQRALRFRQDGETVEQAYDRSYFGKVRDRIGREILLKATSQPNTDNRNNPRPMTAMQMPTPAAHTLDHKSAADDNARLEELTQQRLRSTSKVMSKTQALMEVLDSLEGRQIRERDKARSGCM